MGWWGFGDLEIGFGIGGWGFGDLCKGEGRGEVSEGLGGKEKVSYLKAKSSKRKAFG